MADLGAIGKDAPGEIPEITLVDASANLPTQAVAASGMNGGRGEGTTTSGYPSG